MLSYFICVDTHCALKHLPFYRCYSHLCGLLTFTDMVMKDAKVSLSDVHPIQSCLSHVSVSTMDFPVFSSNVSLPCESSKSCHRTQNYFYDGNIVTASSYSNHDLPQHQLNFLSVVPLSGRDNVFEICDSKLSFTTSSNTHHLPMDYTASDMIRKVHK